MSRRTLIGLGTMVIVVALAAVYLLTRPPRPVPPTPTPAPTQRTFASPLATPTEALHPPNFITPEADRRPQDAVTPSPAEGRAVELAAADGQTVAARYWSPAASQRVAAVVLLPEPDGQPEDWTPFAAQLQAAGFAALALAGPEAGSSEAVAAALDWLAQQAIVEPQRLGIVAAGERAALALDAASQPNVRAVVLLSPQLDAAATSLTAKPLFLIAAADDTGAADIARQMDARATGPHALRLVEGNARGPQLLAADGTAAQALVDWLTGALAPLAE